MKATLIYLLAAFEAAAPSGRSAGYEDIQVSLAPHSSSTFNIGVTLSPGDSDHCVRMAGGGMSTYLLTQIPSH